MTRPREQAEPAAGEAAIIAVRHLHKRYGRVAAVRDVSFEVLPGEVVGFLGPNGAGKTTTIRVITGMLGATSGRVLVDGHDVTEEPIETRKRIGYMAENVPLYPELRVGEYLSYRAQIKGIARKARAKEVARVMDLAQVADHHMVLIGDLSKGYRQRVGLADALLGSPPILILDEPTAGMDPNQIREVRKLIRSLAGKHAVLLSTHIMSEVEATCDRAIIIHEGKLVAQGTIEKLRRLRRSPGAKLLLRGRRSEIERFLDKQTAATYDLRETDDDLWTIHLRWNKQDDSPGSVLERLVADLVKADIGVQEAQVEKPSLEEVFAALTEAAPNAFRDVDERNADQGGDA